MALFSRSLKPEGGEGAPAPEAEAEKGARHTIGELLRETRQSYGGEVDRIAGTLRIRAAYLTAIENGQYDKLPGPVYAQGFVRAYAVHLGLDGDEAIRRFKQEIDGFEVTRDLSFPVPLAERSIPGGTMLLAALILAICGYGLWYYVSTGDRMHPDRVGSVPPDMAASQAPPPGTAPPPAGPPIAAAPSTIAATPSSPAPAPAQSSPTVTSSAAATPAPTPAATPMRTAAPQVASAPAASAPPTPATPPPAAQIASVPTTQPVAPPPTDTTAEASAPPGPRVFGAPPNVPARIVVHAVKDSWVQVRNGDEVLLERILHPGDTVRIPDESGLSLKTGNGAGIALEIDGKLGKPLSGTVRTLALDASHLGTGAAPSGPARTQ